MENSFSVEFTKLKMRHRCWCSSFHKVKQNRY